MGVVSWSIALVKVVDLKCRACRSPLDIHQPNTSHPQQFLATCERCNIWYRVETQPGDRSATVMQIPEINQIPIPEPVAAPRN